MKVLWFMAEKGYYLCKLIKNMHGSTMNGKLKAYLGSLCLVVTFAAGSFAGTPPWSYKNTGQNHTILIPNTIPILINEMAIDSGDFIGVFFDSLGTLACAGYTVYKGETTALSAWGEDDGEDGMQNGEAFQFKLWDVSSNKEFYALAEYNQELPSGNTYISNGMSGLTSLKGYSSGQIFLETGWNLISSNIKPLQNIDELFGLLNGSFMIMRNESGSLYYPDANIFELDSFKSKQSYWIKMYESDTLELFGIETIQTAIQINAGFQLTPYYTTHPALIDELFGAEISSVRLIRDVNGGIYWPEMNRTDLSTFDPASAYIIHSDSSFTVDFENLNLNTSAQETTGSLFHFTVGNTDNCMFFGIDAAAWDSLPEAGDEIAITDLFGAVYGAVVYTGGNIGFPVWGNDNTTEGKDGLNPNEQFTVKIWKQSTGFENIIEIENWLEGDSTFAENKYNIVGKIRKIEEAEERDFDIEILSNYAQNQYYCDVIVPENSRMVIDLFTIRGQLINVLINEEMPKGKSRFIVNNNFFLERGIYLIRMQGAERMISKTFFVN